MSRRPLDQTIQREIAAVLTALPESVRSEFPTIAPLKSLKKLSGGYANLVYEVNDNFLLRVFFRQGWESNFETEQIVLGMLPEIQGIPRVLSAGTLPLEWPCPYLLLNKLPGENAFSTWANASDSVRKAWTNGIASILRQVHIIPILTYGSLHNTDGHTSWQAFHDEKIARLLSSTRTQPLDEPIRRLVTEAEEYYAEHRKSLLFQSGPRLVHGDVRLHNVIVDGNTLSGIIDWEWGHGGEPEEDLVNIARFSLFPDHEAIGTEMGAKREEYAPLLPLLLSAYHELATVPDLAARLIIYLIEADLGQLTINSEMIRHNAELRLTEWLRGNALQRWLGQEGNI